MYSKKYKYFLDVYRKTPLLVPGVDPFSYANIYALDQLNSRNQNRFRINNLSSIKSNLTLDYQMPEKKVIQI
jgi:hypothetical protein